MRACHEAGACGGGAACVGVYRDRADVGGAVVEGDGAAELAVVAGGNGGCAVYILSVEDGGAGGDAEDVGGGDSGDGVGGVELRSGVGCVSAVLGGEGVGADGRGSGAGDGGDAG